MRFLPHVGRRLLVHARRALILPEEHRPKIFHTKMPQSIGTFLVDGAVAGHVAAGRRRSTPFDGPDAGAAQAVDAEARRLAEFSLT